MAEEKITYILGAGASIGAFPIVKPMKDGQWKNIGLADALIKLANDFEFPSDPDDFGGYEEPIKNKITIALRNIGLEGKNFGNIDSYAKYLYHINQKGKFAELKLALTFYFMHTHLCKRQTLDDKRYLNFVTSLVNQDHQFPKNVKILNWNYDYLLERAFMLYRDEQKKANGEIVKNWAYENFYPRIGREDSSQLEAIKNNTAIVHLNGIAGIYLQPINPAERYFESLFEDLDLNNYESSIDEKILLNYFDSKYSTILHSMTFAWEKNDHTKKPLLNSTEVAKSMIKDTTTLVIIGYSFPFYNREVDNMFFNETELSLKKIYYQDPQIDGQFLRNRYSLFVDNPYNDVDAMEIEHIKNVDQFYIPVEL